MGIYDRDYIRNQPPPRSFGGGGGGMGFGISSMRMWSVNTWLIVICFGVFMLDGFLPAKLIQMSNMIPLEGAPAASGQVVPLGWDQAAEQLQVHGTARLDMVDKTTGQRVGYIFVKKMPLLQAYLHFSTERAFLKVEFWRLIGFQFLHANLTHVLFNMIGLFFFGPLVERHLGSKRYLAFYLLCGIFGALMYLLLNIGAIVLNMIAPGATLPGLLFTSEWTPLIGASAGVFGVLLAGAYLAPNARVLLFFVFPLRLRTFAYLLVGLAIFTLITSGSNAGGEAAHLGGALAGFYFIRFPRHLHGFFDVLGRVDPTSHHYRKDASVRYRTPGQRRPRPGRPLRKTSTQQQVDVILDKIKREGIGSLTDKEKRILREASAD